MPPLLLATDIGNRLRELREAMEWTQEDLGRELGRGRQSVLHWEAGKVKPPRHRLEEFCRRHRWPLEMFTEGGPRPRKLLLTAPAGAPQEVLMPDFSAATSVATLQNELRYIEAKLTDGSLTPDGLADLKSAVDDVRLRLWGALLADQPADYDAFRQRFRINRAAEICRGVAADLQDGALPLVHPELQALAGAAIKLATRITAAPGAPG